MGGGDINVNQLTTLKQNIDADFDFDEIFDKHGFDKVTNAVYVDIPVNMSVILV